MPAVLEDAQSRLSLLSSAAATASPPRAPGVQIVSDDGSARLRLAGQLQIWHVANHREGDGIDNDDFGFEIRRLRPRVGGSLMNGAVPFEFFGEFARTDTFRLVDAWIGYVPGEGRRFRAGQFVAPFSREEMVSSAMRLGTDFSVANAAFTMERTQGVDYRHRAGDWGFHVLVSDGPGEKNTPYTMDADWGLTARVERKSDADWSRHDDFVGWRGQSLAWLAGAAAHISGGETDADGDTLADERYTDFRATADFGIEGDGWNAMAAVFARNLDAQGVGAILAHGITVQGGVFVADDVDVFAQYAWADDDADRGRLSVLTLGANYYIHGHVLKLTIDASYALDPITPAYVSRSRGFLTDAAGESGQIVIRSQIQALF